MKPVNLAVIGCGRIGQMHAANIARHPGLNLAMVYDQDMKCALHVADKHDCAIADSADKLIQDYQNSGVLIASSTDTHFDYILKCVRSDKPVFCEKPVDLDITRVLACIEEVSQFEAPLQIGFNRRFDPGHEAARKALVDGEIGELRQVIITSRDPEMPPDEYYRVAGGILRDMTIHDFDLARFFLGEEPVEVFAVVDRLIDPKFLEEIDDHDTAAITMRTASGKQCIINNYRKAVYGYDQRVELVGSEGMLISDNQRPHEVRRFTGESTMGSIPFHYFFIERYRESFLKEMEAFSAAVNGLEPDVPTYEDGYRALMLAETAYRSVEEGRSVKVSELYPDFF